MLLVIHSPILAGVSDIAVHNGFAIENHSDLVTLGNHFLAVPLAHGLLTDDLLLVNENVFLAGILLVLTTHRNAYIADQHDITGLTGVQLGLNALGPYLIGACTMEEYPSIGRRLRPAPFHVQSRSNPAVKVALAMTQ